MDDALSTARLDNGLRIAVRPDRRVPIVAVNLWYHVGSANEKPGRTGFAHLFEHMLFQGSENVAANEHFELVQRAGGTLNGSTWLDRTNYFETLPSNQFALALWLEADRMGRLLPAMTQAKLDTQRDVVKNERRWTIDNQPYGSWWERLASLVFPANHPFHHSLMGSMEDLTAASLADVADFFGTFYTPDNAVLSIVGDVGSGEAIAEAGRYFGDIPAGHAKPPLENLTLPPTFGTWTRETVDDDVMAPRLFLACRIPQFGTPSHDAAMVTAAVLGDGLASRLHRKLVREKQVATSAGVFTLDLAKGADLLVFDVMGRPDTTIELLEGALARELDVLISGCAEATEVDRATALLTTELLVEMQTAQAHADRLSQFFTYFDDPGLAYEGVSRLEGVSPSRVDSFAREYLHEGNRLSLAFVPRAADR